MFYINDIAADTGFKDGNCFEVMNDDANYVDNRTETAWTLLIQIAARANIVIDKVPQMSEGLFKNGITKEQLLGEAYFMRAFAYMNLTDVFYRVPLITDSSIDPTAKEPLASVKDIEKQIENDLFNAKDYLPKSYASRDDAGRPTYGAACGYLARLHMRQAGRARLQGDADAADYYALYPFDVRASAGTIGITSSLETGTAAATSADDTKMLSVAKAAGEELAFTNVLSTVEFSLPDALSKVSEITLNAEGISGNCSVDMDDYEVYASGKELKAKRGAILSLGELKVEQEDVWKETRRRVPFRRTSRRGSARAYYFSM